MNEQLSLVLEFSKAFGIPIKESPTIDIEDNIKNLKISLLKEELSEVIEAIEELSIKDNNDISHLAKELSDLLYVLYGTVIAFGLQYKFDEIFEVTHQSNMSKLDKHGNSILRKDGKILKSDIFFKAEPLIKKILE